MDITLNYFELFQLPVACELNANQLERRYKELHRAVHPDRYAGEPERQKRLAVQYAAYVNEAYTTLKSLVNRYIYLLQLAGCEIDMDQNSVLDSAFLMEQMALRESVDALSVQSASTTELQQLTGQVDRSMSSLSDQFCRLYQLGGAENLAEAGEVVGKMKFIDKVKKELKAFSLRFHE